MKISIRDYRGIARADIDLSGLTLVAGRNGAGKSAIAEAAAAVLTGQTLPVSGITKSGAGALVREGAPMGEVTLARDDANIANVKWPSAQYATDGTPPTATTHAAGLVSVLDVDARKRAAALIQYLGAEPTRDDLALALRDSGITETAIDVIWKTIEGNPGGWDDAHERARSTGQKLKGRWEQATGENYGSRKAESWCPPDWEDDLATKTADDLAVPVTLAHEFLETAIAGQAIDGAKRKVLEESAARAPALAETVERLDRERTGAFSASANANIELRTLSSSAASPPVQPCPHCRGDLVVVDGRITKPDFDIIDREESARRESAIAGKRREVEDLHARYAADDKSWSAARHDLDQANADAKTLREMPTMAPSAPGAVERHREEVRRAEARMAAFQAKEAADRIHETIASNQAIIAALAPDGLRKQRLIRMLREFNEERLRPLCAIAGWREIAITPTLDVTLDGRAYVLLSASERYRCRVVLAMAMAGIDGSAALILDAADILDRAGRNGLFRLARRSAAVPVLVCMTLGREEAERLAASGRVSVYWLEEGMASPVAALRHAA